MKRRKASRAERSGFVPSAWRTTPINRRKVRVGSRVSRSAHRPGVKLRAQGEHGLAMLDLLHTLESV